MTGCLDSLGKGKLFELTPRLSREKVSRASMMLPRLHLFELEDQPWFPGIIRDLATDYLCFMQATFRLHRLVVPLLAESLRATGHRQIVDLCSGGGGPVPEIQNDLSANGLDTHITLTDRFPNLPAFRRTAEAAAGRIGFVAESVDARSVPDRLRGFRTIFNSFHHFAPAEAQKILRNAAEAGQPIGVFEYPERSALIILLTAILTPFLVAVATPFMRPFRWPRFLFTYLLPLVPLTCWWDGIISQLRAYTVGELESLAADAAGNSYEWRAGSIALPNSPGHLTYLLGLPLKDLHRARGAEAENRFEAVAGRERIGGVT